MAAARTIFEVPRTGRWRWRCNVCKRHHGKRGSISVEAFADRDAALADFIANHEPTQQHLSAQASERAMDRVAAALDRNP